ncbi:DUF2059 domain-containing protein [Shewanella electrodiphila]|uniref:DUF2059 domain-containing protein n=1 Tax=Shewanella electrodiphila TaxID=934143 RepID=A0ABT0KQI3_9GAMM|nr:DUF2059 domain-containing protein [Shewanella electrodiphila]MCL1046087.1 DUF2059 domain-containing protein [Shewanella electrodiphila]
MKKVLILPLLFMTFSAPVMAEEAAIDKMFKVMNMDTQMNGGFEAMLPVIDQMSAQFQLNEAGKAELKQIFRTWFNEDIDRAKIINEIKALYSESFTDDELKAVTEFYQTPVGQKFLEKSPQLMQSGAQIGMQEAQSKQTQLMERVQPFLEKHGVQH